MNRKIFILIVAFLLIFNISLFLEKDHSSNDLEVTVLNIGQGDSILIKTPDNNYGLIDAGRGNKVMEELSNTLPFYVNTFDFIILTHPDADHVEGFLSIFEKYQIKNVFIEKVPKETEIYNSIINKLKKLNNTKVYSVTQNNDFKIGEVIFNIVWPDTLELDKYKDDVNQTSIGVVIEYKDFELYSAGDLGKVNEVKSLYDLKDKSIDVLKVGHHGSKSSTSSEFLDLTHIKIAAISVGNNNPYHHPNSETMKLLEDANLNIYRTDEDGRIKIQTDGELIQLSTQNGTYMEESAK